MKVKTSDLIGAQLDWVVATCEGSVWSGGWYECPRDGSFNFKVARFPSSFSVALLSGETFSPSTDWSQGGPIIEREGIHLFCDDAGFNWTAAAKTRVGSRRLVGWRTLATGPTPLIAAMRCYVASKLGNEVDIPDELMEK